MHCTECHNHIDQTSRNTVYLDETPLKVFCGRTCLGKFNDKENRRRERRLKEIKREREQKKLTEFVRA
jgi:hypothetical protein